jgi:tryptophan synthase beta chain
MTPAGCFTPAQEFFGGYGGRYVAETLRAPLEELDLAWRERRADPVFLRELDRLLADYGGRPTPLLFAGNATRAAGGADLFIKLEGLANTGAHKINNALGQALLARSMGKTRVIAETGAGQHGVATAAVCAKLGLRCRVYMGEVDMQRQRPNVFWMQLYGAEVVPVRTGSRTLKDAVGEALRDWAESFTHTHYLLGSALGPAPYPHLVASFQAVIGREVQSRLRELGREPEALVACVGGGSNALGLFAPYLESDRPRLVGVEAGGRGNLPGEHAARMTGDGRPGIVHGYKSLFLLDPDGQVGATHSVSAGLDYPGIGPQLAHLGETGRVSFTRASDAEALDAVRFFARQEGVVFALESAHAGAEALKQARRAGPGRTVVVNMSGRGDKDLFILARALGDAQWGRFLRDEARRVAGGDAFGEPPARGPGDSPAHPATPPGGPS